MAELSDQQSKDLQKKIDEKEILMRTCSRFHILSTLARLALLVALGAALVSCPRPGPVGPPPPPPGSGGAVHGSVWTRVGKDVPGTQGVARRIFLPDIEVHLEDAGGTTVGPSVTSNLDGHFLLPRQPAGRYKVCWKAPGFVPGCTADFMTLDKPIVYPKPLDVTPESGVVFGRVMLKDGAPCRFLAPDFAVDAFTRVTLLDGAGATVIAVRANSVGDYVLPKAPAGRLQVTAKCEASEAQAAATSNSLVNLTLPNSRPRVSSVVAFATSGSAVRVAAPSDQLGLKSEIHDPDGDTLHYAWRATASGAPFTSVDATSVSWVLPSSGGLHSIYVLASDGKGGYARGRLDMPADGKGVLFSGTVVDASGGAPVSGASVSVNGVSAKTNPAGAFFLYVKPESSRYVFNIEKDSYEPVLKIASGGLTGALYRLHRADVFTIDPTKKVDVTTKGEQQRQRVSLSIPAKSLVGPGGTLATAPLQLSLSPMDIADPLGRWPGDGSAVNASGQDAVLTPYAAAHVQVKDPAGNLYTLAPGKKATLRITVHPMHSSGLLLPSVPHWTYDRTKGIWRQDPGVVFKLAPGRTHYEAQVTHFSELNVDVQKTGPAACVRVHTDATVAIPYNVRITVPATATTPLKTVTKQVDNPLSVIIQLPPNLPNVKVEVLDGSGNVVLTPGGTVAFTSPAGIANHFPTYAYTECGAPNTADITIGLTAPAPPASGFLTFGNNVDDDTSANAYYDAIDPGATKATLTAWKNANGFGTTGAGEEEASAAYLNAGDLGLGRFMNVHKKANNDIAFYVSNYGIPPNLGSADFAAAARLCITNPTPGCNVNDHLIATVAMEFTQTGGAGPRYTKFYVFNAAGNRVNKADLDGNGDKRIPGLCIVCHGGSRSGYNPMTNTWADNGNTQAQFIPFDVESFKYSALDPSVTKAGQQGDFNKLNRLLRDFTGLAAAHPISDLTSGWYGVAPGAAIPAATPFDENWIPDNSWRTNPTRVGLYSQVVEKSCRSCHITREGRDWNSYDLLDTVSGFDNPSYVKQRVCSERVMPQALVTFLNFWLSTAPNQPATLANAGLTNWGAPTCP